MEEIGFSKTLVTALISVRRYKCRRSQSSGKTVVLCIFRFLNGTRDDNIYSAITDKLKATATSQLPTETGTIQASLFYCFCVGKTLLVVSHAIQGGSREVTVALNFISERSVKVSAIKISPFIYS
jgi:hypothetical protein